MTVVGFAVGFRIGGSTVDAVAAFLLTILYGFAFVWLFIALGLMAGSPQAAQGCLPRFPLELRVVGLRAGGDHAGWLQGFATNQPLTQMVNTARLLTGGPAAERLLGHRSPTNPCRRCCGRRD